MFRSDLINVFVVLRGMMKWLKTDKDSDYVQILALGNANYNASCHSNFDCILVVLIRMGCSVSDVYLVMFKARDSEIK